VEKAYGRCIDPKWTPDAIACAPYSETEIRNAFNETAQEAAKGGRKPNSGLLVSILKRYRNTSPEQARAHTRERSQGPPQQSGRKPEYKPPDEEPRHEDSLEHVRSLIAEQFGNHETP
jgi:hypothetical protein